MIYEYYRKKIMRKAVKTILVEMWKKKPSMSEAEYISGWCDCYWKFAELLSEIENGEHE